MQNNPLPILAIMVAFMVYLWWTQSRQRKQRQEMLDALKVGDRVMTAGGVYGTVRAIDGDVLDLEIAEDVTVQMSKQAVSSIVTGDTA